MTILKTSVIVITYFFTFFYYAGNVAAESFPPMQEALDAMESDEDVMVTTVEVLNWGDVDNYHYVFEPQNVAPTTGFIIYPGARVDPRAYAPAAHRIAEKGYFTVIVKMPGDIGLYGQSRANEIINEYVGIKKWVIGGHSDGGAMACGYAKDYTEKIVGVVIWASFPSEMFRIDDKDLMVISIYGTEDGFVDEIRASREHLPEDAQFVEIEGGNHTQFGWYDTGEGPQAGDGIASITREEQQEIIIQATTEFLGKISGKENCPAVAILGEENPLLETLRRLRDEVLTKNAVGSELIKLYYENSEFLIAFLQEHLMMKKMAKNVLELLVPAIEKLLEDNKRSLLV